MPDINNLLPTTQDKITLALQAMGITPTQAGVSLLHQTIIDIVQAEYKRLNTKPVSL
jgi:hypothetical protein